MIFSFEQDVFLNPSHELTKELDIIWHLVDDRHTLYIDDMDVIDALRNSDWYKGLRKSYRDIIDRQLKVNTPQNAQITISNKNDTSFSTAEAIRFFNQPVSIILENSTNDGYFVKAIIKHFGNDEIKRHLENGWLKLDNGSGSGIQGFIEGNLTNFDTLPKANKATYLRYFVLLDSDKEHPQDCKEEYPQECIKQKYLALIRFLKEQNIPYHILQKREMENYMPEEVFFKIASTPQDKKWSAAYTHPDLTPTQKDYLNIPDGFPKHIEAPLSKKQQRKLKKEGKTNHTTIRRSDRAQLTTQIQELYTGVSDTNFDILDKGFQPAKSKSEFPKNFLDDSLTKKMFQERCNSDELQNIISKITNLL